MQVAFERGVSKVKPKKINVIHHPRKPESDHICHVMITCKVWYKHTGYGEEYCKIGMTSDNGFKEIGACPERLKQDQGRKIAEIMTRIVAEKKNRKGFTKEQIEEIFMDAFEEAMRPVEKTPLIIFEEN